MMDGYRKSAMRLSVASHEDRAWVLAQLDPADRLVLLEALKETVVHDNNQETADARRIAGKNAALLPAGSVVTRLMSADVETMVALLDREPSWVIALVVGEASFPWVEDYLAQLRPGDLRHLETVVRQTQTSVRPRVRQAVIASIARRLETHLAGKISDNAFDSLVASLRRQSKDVPKSEDA
jgi:hypothetical protein